MNAESVIGSVVAAAVFIYLVYTLLRPEKF